MLFELDKNLYFVSIIVEGLELNDEGTLCGDQGDDDDGCSEGDDDGSDDQFDDLEDPNELMETARGHEQTPKSSIAKDSDQSKGSAKSC
jgi:hypothetical protein